MNTFSNFLSFIQLKPRFLFGVSLVSGALLFLPKAWVDTLNINFRETPLHTVVGVVFLISLVFFFVQLIPDIQRYVHQRKARKHALAQIDSLSADEWTILYYCLSKNVQTIHLPLDNQYAHSLLLKGIVWGPSGGGFNILAVPYTIHNFVWLYLLEHSSEIKNLLPIDEAEMERRCDVLHQHVNRYSRI